MNLFKILLIKLLLFKKFQKVIKKLNTVFMLVKFLICFHAILIKVKIIFSFLLKDIYPKNIKMLFMKIIIALLFKILIILLIKKYNEF